MKKKIINIVLLNVIVFFALISIHEIAHLTVGQMMGCERGKAVLLDSFSNGPYTELVCTGGANQAIIYLSGLLLTSCFGLLFLSLNSPGKNMFLVVLGLSLIFSSLDMGIITIEAVVYPTMILGFMSVAAGEYFIASSYIKDEVPFDLFGMQ
jgi:hypothetical protein